MDSIKEISKTLTLKKFKDRFIKEPQGYKDSLTGKIHFCPNDLGFKLDHEDCLESRVCSNCWSEVMDCLKFKSEQKKQAF